MRFDVYCDESSPEVLSDRSANKYLLIGGIWMPYEERSNFKDAIKAFRKEFNYTNEIKWNKVSPSSLGFFKALIQYFFDSEFISFRVIVIEGEKINQIKFHGDDKELSFYKFYYQLLHHWVHRGNEYSIFMDHKVNKELDRVGRLKEVISNANPFVTFNTIQAIPSKESLGIQFADFLTGAVNGKVNNKISSSSKVEIIQLIENNLGYVIQQTSVGERKFNVFKINLGW